MSLTIISPGMLTTVQDGGRQGWLRYGVPASGAMDAVSLEIANRLIGNPPSTAALEVTLGGFTVRSETDRIRLAVSGPGVRIKVDGVELSGDRAVDLRHGQTLEIPRWQGGARAYLAIAGGIDVPEVLGARATHLGAGLGGFQGRALQEGDVVSAVDGPIKALPLMRLPALERPTRPDRLRLIWGPQDDHFDDDQKTKMLESVWTVSNQADRMGARLDGPVLSHNALGADIVSDGIPHGAIQVPGNGKPILLLADRQPTGGYPKIACIISADLWAAGQIQPGDQLRFDMTDINTARAAARAQQDRLATLTRRFVPIDEPEAERSRRLRRRPLLGGVAAASLDPITELAFGPEEDPPGVPGP